MHCPTHLGWGKIVSCVWRSRRNPSRYSKSSGKKTEFPDLPVVPADAPMTATLTGAVAPEKLMMLVKWFRASILPFGAERRR